MWAWPKGIYNHCGGSRWIFMTCLQSFHHVSPDLSTLMMAGDCSLWEMFFCFFSILLQHGWICKCNFSCKSDDDDWSSSFYVGYSSHNQKEKLLLHINNWLWVSMCVIVLICPPVSKGWSGINVCFDEVNLLPAAQMIQTAIAVTKCFVQTDNLYQSDPASFKLFYILFGLKFKIEIGCFHLLMTRQILRFRVSGHKVSREKCNSWMVRKWSQTCYLTISINVRPVWTVFKAVFLS